MKANIRHESGEERWGSPRRVVAIVRKVLALVRPTVSVDPFSEPLFNDIGIQADSILTGASGLDGFADRWVGDGMVAGDVAPRADWILSGYPVRHREISSDGNSRYRRPEDEVADRRTAVVNPPGDDQGENVQKAWRLLDAHHELGWIDSAFWVAFNLNQMQTTQKISRRDMLHPDFAMCIPATRQPFIDINGNDGKSPSHPMFFLLLPSHDGVIARAQRELLAKLCADLGAVR